MARREQFARVREIFLKASSLDQDEQASFLDDICERGSDVRREVESLLDHHTDRTVLDPSLPPPGSDDGKNLLQPPPFEDSKRTALAVRLLGSKMGRNVAMGLATVLAVVLGSWTYLTVRSLAIESNAEQLRMVTEATVTAITLWEEDRTSEVQDWAGDPEVIDTVQALLELPWDDPPDPVRLGDHPAQRRLHAVLEPYLRKAGSIGFSVVGPRGVVVASTWGAGGTVSPHGFEFLGRLVIGNETLFVGPVLLDPATLNPISDPALPDATASATGIRDPDGNVIAALVLMKDADRAIGPITRAAQMRETGETYLFDADGVVLTESRFTQQLRSVGLIPDEPAAQSAFRIQLRDPGGDLSAGHVPERRLEARPLTTLAALAIAGRSDSDPAARRGIVLDPYRNYRGKEVIGAWVWVPKHGFAIATEMEAREAYAPLRRLRVAFFLLLLILGCSIGLGMVYSAVAVRLRQKVEMYEQLGPYNLLEQIGEGGMGKVYLARHALLKRPTAIKILPLERNSDSSRARFEREARLASRLTHPNTIDIYDFGSTPDGRFFYAMEFLDGLSLADLIERDGPISVGRSVFVLRQVCASLREAHDKGLIHRDIKPPNIMLCVLGGEYDFVKVLDFGLVKDLTPSEPSDRTQGTKVGGTPLYIAPEQFLSPHKVDARVDIFAFGSVAYHLLTGQPIFPKATREELQHQVATQTPLPLSVVVDSPIPPELELLVMRCLARDPDERPGSASEVREMLKAVQRDHPWTKADAENWWAGYRL